MSLPVLRSLGKQIADALESFEDGADRKWLGINKSGSNAIQQSGIYAWHIRNALLKK